MPFDNVKLNDGHEIPAIGFGTGSALYGKDARDYVVQAVETGFSHVDTAQIYRNEDSVGEAIRDTGLSRKELFVTTKYGSGPIQETVRESLTKLGLEYVNLYLIHFPTAIENDVEGGWREFEKIKEDGLAKSIGVSNFNVEQLERLVKIAKVKPAVNQIRFHPYNYAEHRSLLEYSAKHGIVTEAYGSLAPITSLPGGPVDAPVNAAAKRLGITPTQAILLWVRAKGAVIVTSVPPIPLSPSPQSLILKSRTSRSEQHLKEYLAVADLPSLTSEEVAAIDEAGAQGPPKKLRQKIWHAVGTLAATAAVYTLVSLLRKAGASAAL
ncbi:hypothetical protein DXG03_001491 [Asterophora parasitica]|uniref:NADP-dependent oxidoreductase domain-containing protein n=1 Tax=Asterophora parasitica TaxID=117018 RepID=A0A9P7G4X8_9AGAR|nr:hypothetical protein DXG03_001491 [Asterophora parasitica]